MNYWLVKTEPETYGWDDLNKLGQDMWDGVRNYQARNHLNEMKQGDLVLFYHSGKAREVVGIAEVVRESYPDPTTDDNRWVVVDIIPKEALKKSVPLKLIKETDMLQNMKLIKQSRLSVMPVEKEEFDKILELSTH
ncbi:EVE domain-containing protein [Limibacter armeniacum]|uniref:EVE domain-containing protein n=1 Tax=Limibacter armeniacum TaxID=466084 RepID=UPI002FE50F60